MNELLEYVTFDDPVPYKGLLLYPIKVRDYIKFHTYSTCLLIDKNSTPDIEIISMGYFDYLCWLSATGADETIMFRIDQLLKMVCQLPQTIEKNGIQDNSIRYYYNHKNRAVFNIDGIEYNSDDFDTIKEIIAYQNCIELIDESISKEVRDQLERSREANTKIDGNKICSFEDQLVCVNMVNHMDFETIKELTLRKFSKILERANYTVNFMLGKIAEGNGATFKEPIPHWMCEVKKESKYKEVMIDMNDMENKLTADGKV